MIVAFDTTVLVYVLDASARAPHDPATGQLVERCAERVEYLLRELDRDGAKIIIPTPVVGELLVKAQGASAEWLRILNGSKYFRLASFDTRAAVEFAAMQASRPRRETPRQKAKFDDQIVAIARVEGAEILYSDDGDIRRIASPHMQVLGIAGLDLPAEAAQGSLPLLPDDRPPNWGTL